MIYFYHHPYLRIYFLSDFTIKSNCLNFILTNQYYFDPNYKFQGQIINLNVCIIIVRLHFKINCINQRKIFYERPTSG